VRRSRSVSCAWFREKAWLYVWGGAVAINALKSNVEEH